jgi:integrase
MSREYGSGNIEEYAPGKWRVRTRIEGKLQTVASGLTEARAREYADALVALQVKADEFTVRHLVELVRAERLRRSDLKPSTLRGERGIWTAIIAEFGATRAVDLARVHIKNWIDRAVSPSTKRNRLNSMRYAFAYAVERELVAANPCDGIQIRGKAGKTPKTELLSKLLRPEHQNALLRELREPKRLKLSEHAKQDEAKRKLLLASVLFALGTGCRLSEQWGVKREDVSESGILIRRSEANASPKSGDWREVPRLPPTDEALRLLGELRSAFPALAKSEWLFPGWRGEQRRWNKHPKGWVELFRACKIPYRNWHWLRHTTATALLAGWWSETDHTWSLEEVRALLGHASVTTTEIYAQLLDDKAFKAAEKTFQSRSSDSERVIVKFREKQESQLPESNWRPTVYETGAKQSDNAGLADKSLQNRNSDDRAWLRKAIRTAEQGSEIFGPWDLTRARKVVAS